MSQQPVSVQSCEAGAQAAGRRGRHHTCQVSTLTVTLQECMHVYIVWCILGSIIYVIASG